ncbi:MAG: tRNA threonylcarbamoyladenosine dehydratase [Oscillospiraceae bacterium]|nr:tRNA threonylcarbamoyladenosine dehydratase [Oscillospiraceae bacterium]
MKYDLPTIRTRMLYLDQEIDRLSECKIAVFGIGGVGSFAAEALARSGVGELTLIDFDNISETNINRQLCALHSTVGKPKAYVMAQRIADINPKCRVNTIISKYRGETRDEFFQTGYDYIADAIDLVSCKLDLIQTAKSRGIPVLSALGAGNKKDSTRFSVCDISQTHDCPLARIMRKELRRMGIGNLDVVWSSEKPVAPRLLDCPPPGRRCLPGSVPWVPGAAGLAMAGHIVKNLFS